MSSLADHESRALRSILWELGYAFCPENIKRFGTIEKKQFFAADDDDRIVINSVRQYQLNFKEQLDLFTNRSPAYGGHGRESMADGQARENTLLVATLPRCGRPDYFPLNEAEEGNWPPQCRNDITISWNFDKLPGTTVERTNSVFQKSADNWGNALELRMVMAKESYPNARGAIVLANLPGSILADQYLAISNCGFTSRGRMDRRDWGQAGFPEATRTHEDGHLLGFEHTQGRGPDGKIPTMNPSITGEAIARAGAPVEGDLLEAERRGYKRREGSQTELIGEHRLENTAGQSIGKFSLREAVEVLDEIDENTLIKGTAILVTGGAAIQEFVFSRKVDIVP